MKVIILAGGYGTRLGSVTQLIPKPMVQVGGRPIIWHIMKTYAHFGYSDFVLSLGYKAEVIKSYFYNYHFFSEDFSIGLKNRQIEHLGEADVEDWQVALVDTGLKSLKGARIKRIEQYLDDVNMVTYGDGVADVNISELVDYHNNHDGIVTITGVYPPARFGELEERDGNLLAFHEKPQSSVGLINGGYMVFDKELLNYLTPDESCDLEAGVLDKLAADGLVRVYKHRGKWECVDNERDLKHLNSLWESNNAFWKVW